MAVYPVLLGDGYQKHYVDGVHLEGIAETETDISNYTTEWGIGSTLLCKETGATWMLMPNGSSKEWTDTTPTDTTADGTVDGGE